MMTRILIGEREIEDIQIVPYVCDVPASRDDRESVRRLVEIISEEYDSYDGSL